MKKILLFFIASSLSTLLFAYPITPRPLRKLIMESECIVWVYVAEVGSARQTNKNDYDWNGDFARIIIKETLQGKLNSDTIMVFFSSGMICPAPGVFFEGEEVLAFLDKREKKDGYIVHALSYGVKHNLTKQDYGIYKDRINEMQKMLQSGETKECNENIVAWLVKCAQQKCTRWEGVYELSPQSDFMSYYDRDQNIQRDIFLTTPQRNNLFAVLMTVDTLDYSDMPLADIVKGINDSLLLDFLKSRLALVHEEFLWPATDIMHRIVDLTGNNELETLVKKFETVYFDYTVKGKKESKKILSDFIIKMKTINLKKISRASGEWNA